MRKLQKGCSCTWRAAIRDIFCKFATTKCNLFLNLVSEIELVYPPRKDVESKILLSGEIIQ